MGGNLSTEAVASSRLRVTRERSITHSNSSAEGTTPTRRVPSFTLQQPQPKVPLPGTTTATTKVTGTSSAHSPANSVLKRDEREDSSANSVPETVSVPANPRPSTDTVNDSNSDSDSYWDLDIGYSPQAGILNATAAKTWHPNNSTNRRSLDLREYHTVDSSDYTLPSDEIEQSRIELQHYTLRHVFKK
ncbi:hypothetical protein HK100_011022 [Physocladia obscura]|uniref:Uncharacterized protein n=1 Tax=Physocladia obscura TaxID=109957 RepID=A0AAD5T2G5_9FUNG|nr:hypothetical protein HK100_011022 [Physocladia obscura]